MNPRSLVPVRLRLGASLLALGALVLGCDKSGPSGPVAAAAVEITPAAPVTPGSTVQLSATVKDSRGNPLSGRAVAWSSGNNSVATVSASGLVTAVAQGSAQITATSDGASGSLALTVLPVPVANVAIGTPPPDVATGTVVQLIATLTDAGGATLTGRTINWSSSNQAIATVDGAGLVSALTPGNVTITATSEGKSGSVQLAVIQVPVSSVVVTPSVATLAVGGTQLLTAQPRDFSGSVLLDRPVLWASSNATIASVTQGGLVTAHAPGCGVAITATSEGMVGTATVNVAGAIGAPCVGAISPAFLSPGTNASIVGSGFSAVPGNNTVTIAGASAAVVGASPTELIVAVPCVSSQAAAAVVVTTNGVPAPAVTHPVSHPAHMLAVGEAAIITDQVASRCREILPAGNSRYLVTVFSVATSQHTLDSFELSGNPVAAGAPTPAAVSATAGSATAGHTAPVLDPVRAAQDEAHFRHLERDRAEYARLRALGAGRAAAEATPSQTTPLPTIGQQRNFFYMFGLGCANNSQVITARAIYVGTRGIIWEDVANALQSSANAGLAGYYQRLGQIFDQDQYDAVKNNFGDPLRRDAITDNDGRVHMVFSQRLNGSGAAAYVTSCDLFPPSPGNAASNFGEFFYGSVPTSAGSNPNSTSFADGWFYFMARTVVHEVKHIASLAARVAVGSPAFESGWLEEGTARHAEEVWIRAYLHNVVWKANTGWGTSATNGVYCDFHPMDATCNALDPLRRPSYGMRRHFNEIRNKLLQPWNWSPYGDGTGQSGSVFYQTTWSLVRYAIDRFGTSDAAFLSALNNTTLTGTTNLMSVSGASLEQLIGGWGLALFADDYPGFVSPSPATQVPTWNLRSIYAGLNASPNWSGTYPTPFPIQPTQLGFGSFLTTLNGIRGGAHAFFEISGNATQPQLLHLRAPGGGTPSSHLRIAIVRLQ